MQAGGEQAGEVVVPAKVWREADAGGCGKARDALCEIARSLQAAFRAREDQRLDRLAEAKRQVFLLLRNLVRAERLHGERRQIDAAVARFGLGPLDVESFLRFLHSLHNPNDAGIGRNNAYEGVRTGSIPSIRVGKRILVPKVALDRLLDGGV